MRFEILIAEDLFGSGSPNIYLDTFQEESISLNFNIADITDIASKNSSYSKTIKLPDTARNRQAFSDIFNIEASGDGRTFNPNKKVACIILGDTLEIFRGNLQLTNISYDFNINRHSYDVVVYSDNDSLFKSIGEQYLTDLDLSRYDHILNRTNIEQSWNTNFINGYFYPLIDYGFPLTTTPFSIKFGQLRSSIYAKTIFDQIFSEAGFSYKSDFLNSPRFTDLIIPFNNKNFVPVVTLQADANFRIFSASLSATYSIPNRGQIAPESFGQFYYGSFNCDTDSFDPNNLYDTTNRLYRNLPNESYKQRFKLHFKLQLQSASGQTDKVFTGQDDDIIIWCKRSMNTSGVTNPNWSNTPTYGELSNPSDPNYFRDVLFNGAKGISCRNVIGPQTGLNAIKIPPDKWTIEGECTTDWLDSDGLRPGEEVRFFLTRTYIGPTNQGVFRPPMYFLAGTFVSGFLDNITAIFSSRVLAKDMLPTKVKQKEFVISIFKMFNLYIEPSKDQENLFVIEPRDEYYSKYQVQKDWSDKIDLSQPIDSEILSNLQKRTNLFTYKEDKDYYNTNYKTNTNEIFGQFKFELDNDFISDENIIEPIFSPTPIDRLAPSSNIYLPIIYGYNNGNTVTADGMNIRILYKKMIPSTEFGIYPNITYTSYPYAGFADDPVSPTFSLNFGSISPFYTGYNETLNNLFNTYYRNQISELNDRDSRLITASFNLNSYDINNFRFSDLIFFTINGMSDWYRVVKIMDYDPVFEKLTKVQLIKAYNYTLGTESNTASYRVNPYIENGLRNLIAVDNVYVGVINTSTSNRTTVQNVAMIGSDNSIAVSNNLIVGNNNSGWGQNSVLVGQSNQTTTGQTLVVGDSNTINGANSMSIGSRNLVSTPQSFVLGIDNKMLTQNPSQSGTQSLLVVGNNNISQSTSGFVYGDNNLIGVSASNVIIFGSNNNIGFTASGPSGSSLESVFVVGSNITLTQSSSSLFYVGYDTIEFNTQNFITNVVGTSSFNKMVIADLVLQDVPNNTFGKFRLNQYNPTDYPGGSYLEFNSPITGLEMLYNDFDSGYLYITRSNQISGSSQVIQLNDDEVKTIINTTSSTVTESILLTNSQIFKVNNQISHKILGEELDLTSSKNIYLSDFYYDYMDFFTSSTLDIDIMVRYNSGIEVGFDYLSQRSWYTGGGMSVFTATGSRVSYNNLTSPNDVQSYIQQVSSLIWGGDEPTITFEVSFGFTASFYYEINLKYNSI